MRLSFILPVYNVARYLEPCVQSIIAQGSEDDEIILVDDGSTDGSGALCDALAQRCARVRVVHPPNGGTSVARNAGLDVAQGDWVCFVDSDDLVSPRLIEATREYLTGEYDIVLFSWKRFSTDGDPSVFGSDFSGKTHVCTPEELRFLQRNTLCAMTHTESTALGIYYLIGVCGCLMSRAIIERERLRFLPDVASCEDVIFKLQYLAKCQSAICVDRCLYYYRRNTESKTMRFDPDTLPHLQTTLRAMRSVVRADFADSPEMVAQYHCEAINLSKTCFLGELIHPQFPGGEAEKLNGYARLREAIADSVRQCDRSLLASPINRLLDAYRVPDERRSFGLACNAVRSITQKSGVKRWALTVLSKLHLADALKRVLRRLKNKRLHSA